MSLGISDVSGTLEAVADFSSRSPADPVATAPRRSIVEPKRLFDIHVAVAALIVLAPLLATVALVLFCAQGRPIVIRHRRIGRGGATFPCFKFRTMVRNADDVLKRVLAEDPAALEEWQVNRKLRRDPRITAFGRVLRETSIDEIPQLFNVLRGHMSLVGPRPIVADEVEIYGPKINHYYKVRPGVTGAWQVGGRSDVGFGQRVELDVAYVLSRSFRADLHILFRTVPAVLGRKGSR